MSGVQLRDLRKSFGGTEVIRGVDLDIREGEFVVFVGPSGCGKSTLLRMIAGLEDITSGEVVIDGRVCNDDPPKRRGIAMVFQSYALYPHKSVRANMAFGLRIAGTTRAEIDRRVSEAARILEIERLLDRRPSQLSGGQRQRVAIGRAIVRDPKVFLFDEPLSNLDAALRVNMRMEIARLHDRLGATMAYVTHDQVEAMTLADRIVVLEAGRARQVGTPMELYHAPVDRFVAGFIGSPRMNFLEGEIAGADGAGAVLRLRAGAKLRVPVSVGDARGPATLGVRPEHAVPVDEAGDVEGRVEVVERLGPQTQLGLRLTDGTTLIATADGADRTRVGETRRIAFEREHLHLFGADERGAPLPGVARPARRARPGVTGRIGTKGERMVELGQREDGLRCRGFAGVGFDTACSQRRLLPASWEAGCVTAVGSDALSDGMPRSMEGKGVATSRVLRRDDRTMGLDAIAPRDGGRAFSRWRSRSAARLPAEDPEALAQGFDELDAAHVSAISVAVPEGRGRETLLAVVSAAAERGTRVSSDTDYRQRSGRARERRKCGRSTSPPPTPLRPRAMTARRPSPRRSPRSSWSAASASAPRRPCRPMGRAPTTARRGLGASSPPAAPPLRAVNTTVAGDASDAAFVTGRLRGASLREAMRAGQAVARQVVARRGALVRLGRRGEMTRAPILATTRRVVVARPRLECSRAGRACVSSPPGTSVSEFAPPPGSRGERPGHPRGAVPPRLGSPVAGDPSPIDPPAVDRGTGR